MVAFVATILIRMLPNLGSRYGFSNVSACYVGTDEIRYLHSFDGANSKARFAGMTTVSAGFRLMASPSARISPPPDTIVRQLNESLAL